MFVLVDEFHESPYDETSYPDIDSTLEAHLGFGDFSYKTRTVDGTTEHVVMKHKSNQWKVHLKIEDDEITTFNDEELATFLILQIRMDRAIKRRVVGLLLIAIVIAIPVVLYSIMVLGIQATDDFEQFLIVGGITVALIPIFCLAMSSAERSVDESVYAIRPNLIDVFQKMIDLRDNPFEKTPIEKRIQRLKRPYDLDKV